MKIKLISEVDHADLVKLASDYPKLVFQNKGYEYINKNTLTEEELKKIELIETLLKEHIVGFSKFNNFCHSKSGELKLRFQYNYGAEDNATHFIGVGYIKVDELLNGFKETDK